MDEVWDSWDVGLSSVSSIFWLTFKLPLGWPVGRGPQGHPQSPVSPQCPAGPLPEATSVGATKWGCPGVSWGRRVEPQLGSITWDGPFPLSIPSVMQKVARSRGTPPARGIPPAPRTLCLLLPQPSQGISVSVAGGSGTGVLVGGCCSVPPCPSLLITAEQRSGIKGSH